MLFRSVSQSRYIGRYINAKQKYTFRMYRDRSRTKGSLLNVSAPDPLCVDLVQNNTTIRRFCKPYNVLNGLGEFVEQKI